MYKKKSLTAATVRPGRKAQTKGISLLHYSITAGRRQMSTQEKVEMVLAPLIFGMLFAVTLVGWLRWWW